ncbi:MAG: SWIM zinc finger family protein [Thermoplasmatota archaeon]
MDIKTIYDINRESINYLFSDIIFLRGEEYYEEGHVTSIDPIDTTTISAVVQGNQDYVVSISLDDEGAVLCDCSCPCDFNCKHAVATLLKWITIKNDINRRQVKTSKAKKESIEEILGRKNKTELINLLQIVLKKHPELTSYVRINTTELIIRIRNLFSQFWEGYELKELISQLETILDGIRNNKSQWNNQLFQAMKQCTKVMIKNQEQVYDEGELSLFLEEWMYTFGEVFSEIETSQSKKESFVETIVQWIEEDNYDLEYAFQQAFVGICKTKNDIQLIEDVLNSTDLFQNFYYDFTTDFLLEAYDKLDMHDAYIKTSLQSELESKAIDKLMTLNRYEEALRLINQSNNTELNVEMRRAAILKKLGRTKEWQQSIIQLIKDTGSYSYVPQLKKGSSKKEWEKFRSEIIKYAKTKGRKSFLSRLYYNESDYEKAYQYARNLTDESYLELLAEKLCKSHPKLSCNLFKKLCFDYINKGSGWPYKKAGKMLKAIKKIDTNGTFFKKTKDEIITIHKKKYSLMHIIEKI